MRQSIAAELLVLRKRASTWILLATWVALATTFAYLVPYVTYLNADIGAGALPSALLPKGLAGTVSGGFPFFGGVFALMLGVLSLGGEYGWDTVKTLLTQRPGRLAVFGAKLAALAVVLALFVLAAFAVGALTSYAIVQLEGVPVTWPEPWLLLRAHAAGWLVLAVWGALGVLLAVASRGTALAIGIGVLYALVIEGLVSALASQVGLLDPLVELFLRANGYSLVEPLGVALEDVAGNGPGAFSGPFVGAGQALSLLGSYMAAFLLASALLLRRRDVQ